MIRLNPRQSLVNPSLISYSVNKLSKKFVFLTNAACVVKVLLRLYVGLQLITIIANINPLISHYLLMRKEKESSLLRQ